MLYGEKKPGAGRMAAMGFVATLLVHGAVIAAILIGRAHAATVAAEPIGQFVDVKVVKFGKRDLSFLPHKAPPAPVVKPKTIKLTENAEAKPLPRIDDKKDDKKPDELRNLPKLPTLPTSDPSTGSAQEEGDPKGMIGGDSKEGKGPIYLQHLVAAVQNAWSVPTTISDDELAKLTAKVFIQIDDQGNVAKAEIRKSSGNDLFDSSLAEALQTVKKFDPPPDDQTRRMIANGILLNFHFDKQR